MGTPIISRGSTTRNGDLQSGSGATTLASSGLGRFNVDWQARTASHDGWRTSPEELLAAAHSACFAMQLSHELTQNGTRPTQLDATAEVTFVPGTGINGIHLDVTARVLGILTDDFRRIAESAAVHCPLTQALAGTEITLTTTLAQAYPVHGPGSGAATTAGDPARRGRDAHPLKI
ncbi:OsmC family peroxiredoxin [Georgenia sp. SYP-B2076]|uniref:OsmC family peroxiredoxin n=1 Tax=Georgenia sp. SYP-B2076 TaxID=2495881 RepID=UPI000F8D328A